ncbi:poly-gamma-glutamate synthesis protein (capsule biosynthesis protein) [Nitrosospira sp. Nsp2]|uniref:CapA family protein n=1 Tax=Nitrosospira sp. Nsp2 TaxID=136548 RepID=UPI000D301401|nr:CapA family protein [Nitrosospira sp. Nsp2]PTR13501.1 poly-gamma-glutamate synthesis protein (capsule biosynthesis protein) [Nitrosospira sp. Nsp2]
MKNWANPTIIGRQLKRRKFLVSALSTGLTAAVRPLYGQTITTDNALTVKHSVQNRSEAGVEHSSLITLFLCGDVMTGRGIDQVLPHPGNPILYEGYMKTARGYVELAEEANGPIPKAVSFSYIWGDALTELERRQPNCRIINLETAVTRSDDVQDKAVNYRMNPDNIACITAARIDCCGLANNHVLDWGYSGLAETLSTLKQAGLKTAGAGNNISEAQEPAMLSVPGRGRVLVLSFGSETSGIPFDWVAAENRPGVDLLTDFSRRTIRGIRNRIAAVKRSCDVVVGSIHWGGNWGYHIPREQQEFAHRLIDEAGVDVVHGHSSHHVKGIEVYNSKLILYGCGDFLNDYEGISGHETYRGDLTVMYFVRVDASKGTLVSLEIIPLQMKRFRLNHASADDALWLQKVLDREGKRFGNRVEASDDNGLMLQWTS